MSSSRSSSANTLPTTSLRTTRASARRDSLPLAPSSSLSPVSSASEPSTSSSSAPAPPPTSNKRSRAQAEAGDTTAAAAQSSSSSFAPKASKGKGRAVDEPPPSKKCVPSFSLLPRHRARLRTGGLLLWRPCGPTRASLPPLRWRR